MLATVANMRKCEKAGLRPVMFNVNTGETFSATPGDYWMFGDDEVIDADCILARRVPATYSELTDDDLTED